MKCRNPKITSKLCKSVMGLSAIVFFIAYLFPVQTASAAPPLIEHVSANGCDCSRLNFQHEVSGANPLLVVTVFSKEGRNIASVTFGAQSLSRIAEEKQLGGKPTLGVWKLEHPSIGMQAIDVDIVGNGKDKIAVAAISYSGVSLSNPIEGINTGKGIGGSPSLVISSEENDLVQDFLVSNANGMAVVGADQTEQLQEELGGSGETNHYGAASTQEGSSLAEMTWSLSQSNRRWIIIGFNINQASSGMPSYPLTGTYISSEFDTGKPSAFQIIEWEWSKTNESCVSCVVKLQIQTAPDAAGSPGIWSASWSGPEGEDGDETDFYTISTGETIHTDHNGDQWIRYRAILEGDGVSASVLEAVRINYK